MTTPLFTTVDGGETFIPSDHARGPWSPDLLHGGPVAALLAHALHDDEGGGWFPARSTVDLVRPLTMDPVRVETTVLRAGRKARLVEARLHRAGTDEPPERTLVARASLQQLATAPVPVDDGNHAKSWREGPPPAPEDLPRATTLAVTGDTAFHHSAVEHRSRTGLLASMGPERDWIRVCADLLPDRPLSPFERVMAAADFGNGVSASLPIDRYSFVNADLTVHVFRLPVDDWVLVDAVTWVDDDGVGLAESTLYDRRGRIGRACQSLLIQAR